MKKRQRTLASYLAKNYPFLANVGEDGEYYVTFPDLDGLFTGAPTLEELPAMMREGLEGWMEASYKQRDVLPIPEPTILRLDDIDDDYSGKFNLRLPRSLHHALANGAERDGVSLNQYVVSLLSRRASEDEMIRRLDALEQKLASASPPDMKIAEERARYDAGRRAKKPSPRKRSPRRSA
jgi:antitoxin HicB